ncbi:unnamed protein product [Fraxinus pennsylvanica]|uniref:Hyaluronan/mRNA-binding protein domain-containing protein n=1 Tax=Fraxinus pennsylvanica TaxID=56036 RepID=A0AAD1ZTN5_9LAMI|nr:unnamed protein product [Fraxinus pennsylvanica]
MLKSYVRILHHYLDLEWQHESMKLPYDMGEDSEGISSSNGPIVPPPSELQLEEGFALCKWTRRPYSGPCGGGDFRGGRRGGFSNGETPDGECPRRAFDRHSGTGRGNEFKRERSGRGNGEGTFGAASPSRSNVTATLLRFAAAFPSPPLPQPLPSPSQRRCCRTSPSFLPTQPYPSPPQWWHWCF